MLNQNPDPLGILPDSISSPNALAAFADWFLAPEPDWWLAALKSIQSSIAIFAMWLYLIRRERID